MNGSDVAWGTIIISALALTGTVVNSYFAMLERRDKMKDQEDKRDLTIKVERQGEDIKKCEEDRIELRGLIKKCQEEHTVSLEERGAMRERIDTLEKISLEQQKRLSGIQKRANGE